MAGGGGAWKVAYADFVTAMMAFFMVMWITSQSQEVKESVSHYFSNPFGALDANGKSGGTNRTGPVLNMENGQRISMAPMIVRQYISKEMELGTIVYFKPGSAELDQEALSALEALVPDIGQDVLVIDIRGHVGTEPNNLEGSRYDDTWSLACARCLNVQRCLADWQIPTDRIRLHQAGTHEPLEVSKRGKRRYENDRVEVYIPRETADKNRTISVSTD